MMLALYIRSHEQDVCLLDQIRFCTSLLDDRRCASDHEDEI